MLGLAMACLHPGLASRARPRWVPGPGCPVRMIWMLMEFTSLRSQDANLAPADDSDSDYDSDARVPIPAIEPIRQRFRPARRRGRPARDASLAKSEIWAYGFPGARNLARSDPLAARCCLWNRRSCQSHRKHLVARPTALPALAWSASACKQPSQVLPMESTLVSVP